MLILILDQKTGEVQKSLKFASFHSHIMRGDNYTNEEFPTQELYSPVRQQCVFT